MASKQALLSRPELFAGQADRKLLTFALGRGVDTTMRPRFGKFFARPSRMNTASRRSFWESSRACRFR